MPGSSPAKPVNQTESAVQYEVKAKAGFGSQIYLTRSSGIAYIRYPQRTDFDRRVKVLAERFRACSCTPDRRRLATACPVD